MTVVASYNFLSNPKFNYVSLSKFTFICRNYYSNLVTASHSISTFLDLPQVDCENAKASESLDDESEGRSRELTSSVCGILNLICISLVRKKLGVT